MKLLMQCLAIGAGGFLGAIARFLVAIGCARLAGTAFPFGTFVINITGSLFLGWFFTVARARLMMSDMTVLGVATGFVGAYTTFSTFMYESDALLRNGSELKAMTNLLGSVVVGLLAVRVGVWLGTR
jgi:CrcB protein